MFTAEYRDQVRERIIEKARGDDDIAGAAAVGSSASGGDRWSDLDLTFAVRDGATVEAIMTRWTAEIEAEFSAANLFDLAVPPTIYRVFLFPGALQVDLSFSPLEAFGARGPRFELIFGEPVERSWKSFASPNFTFGLAIHHIVRSNICIERGRLWQAEHWLHEARDEALTLACFRHDLPTDNARGFDQLPPEVHSAFAETFVATLTERDLRRALARVATNLLIEADGLVEVSTKVAPMLAEISSVSDTLRTLS